MMWRAKSARPKLAAAEVSWERDAKARKEEEAAALAEAEAVAAAAAAEAAAERAARYRAAVAASLPPEPDADVGGAVSCRFTLPTGSTTRRRFAATDPLEAVFDYVRSVGGAGEGER
jgi:hypothetical protein